MHLKFAINDTIQIDGQDDQGRIWKDRKLTYIVCGYGKVPVEKKEVFDGALQNVIIKQ